MAEQQNIGFNVEQKIDSIEEYKFEPIKGYPMLHWKGKRPFTSTQFYPAQLKENYGQDVNGWMNKIFWGDNLQVMSNLLKEYRGKIDLIYIDPPYDSKADYKKKISLKGQELASNSSSFEEKQYSDIWNNDEYLQFLYERIILIRELLSDRGSFFLHCDYRKVHHIRCMVDEIFGGENLVNHLIWCYTRPTRSVEAFPKVHGDILYYSKTKNKKFNHKEIRIPYDAETLARSNRGAGEASMVGSKQGLERLNEEGKMPEDYWNIPIIQGNALEKTDYPTQKPEKLIERIIKVASDPGDIIFDCFMGSGTTQAVSMKLGRKFIGADINLGAIQTSSKRLLSVAKELNGKLQEEIKYTGFSVYNVNHYDIFRNPLEAKDLLIKALEIQELPNNSIYDGEKDGRLVKVMPINRIATRADLNELITNFDYKRFEKESELSPNKPVASLLLVCMGHEPDLAAELQRAIPYKLDVEIVDILRDKANLEFKRDSEAEIVIEGGKVLIREFYPMNLLQKLSLMKENVENWKELADSIMIDFNYDGAVFEPQVLDVPEGGGLVKGVYNIPNNAGAIRVKITDVLSESFEKTLANG